VGMRSSLSFDQSGSMLPFLSDDDFDVLADGAESAASSSPTRRRREHLGYGHSAGHVQPAKALPPGRRPEYRGIAWVSPPKPTALGAITLGCDIK
jgi:hypothetical protein